MIVALMSFLRHESHNHDSTDSGSRAAAAAAVTVLPPRRLDTGGAIRNAASQLRSGPEDPVVVLNGDLLSGTTCRPSSTCTRRPTPRSPCT